jgi:hypothetical protein
MGPHAQPRAAPRGRAAGRPVGGCLLAAVYLFTKSGATGAAAALLGVSLSVFELLNAIRDGDEEPKR